MSFEDLLWESRRFVAVPAFGKLLWSRKALKKPFGEVGKSLNTITGSYMKAVFLDSLGLNELSLDGINTQCSHLEMYTTTTPEEVEERISSAELIITNKVKIGRIHFEKCPSMKLICVVATGTDIIDLEAAADHNVTVCNCQAYGTDSVVQHVFSSLLALQTNLISYHKAVAEGRWHKADQFCFLDYPITELRGKMLGIIGYGTLGKGVATVAEAFGMKTLICRRPGGVPDNRPSLEEFLPQLDVLTLHCPLTEETRNLVDAKALGLMKPSAFLINCARGGIVNEQALVDALVNGSIMGAAVDVLTVEPPKKSNPLLDISLPNLIVTPHVAWASAEARQRILNQTAENIEGFLAMKPMRLVGKK